LKGIRIKTAERSASELSTQQNYTKNMRWAKAIVDLQKQQPLS
jgi:hypothetical protein